MEVWHFLQLMTYAHSEAVHLLITTTPSGHSLPFQLFITFGSLISIYFGCDYLSPDDFPSELILKVWFFKHALWYIPCLMRPLGFRLESAVCFKTIPNF